ncbi:MAG: metal-dependent hydrolase [Gammaproteobacteria bacterium]|nr:metal-dependent hydrolase [Gammaproteobacteria bacterium]NNM11422.1 metal-dependent hydrolase [Pseudomonadales bacterium]
MNRNNIAENPISQSKLPIERRRVEFTLDDVTEKYYYRGNPQVSAFFASLSVGFPPGEAEFIKSVKLFEDQITDPKLREEVKNFAHQEAHHSFQHKLLNQKLNELGYQTGGIDNVFKEKLARREKQWSPQRRLARTVSAEHITATWAHWALGSEEKMQHFPTSMRHLLQWHAIEEIEHKSVAFDVYQQCVGDRRLLNWVYRHFLYFEFPLSLTLTTRALLKQDNYKPTAEDRRVFKDFLFAKKDGMVSSLWPHYRAFTKQGFHPWALDDSGLVDDWKGTLSPYFAH